MSALELDLTIGKLPANYSDPIFDWSDRTIQKHVDKQKLALWHSLRNRSKKPSLMKLSDGCYSEYFDLPDDICTIGNETFLVLPKKPYKRTRIVWEQFETQIDNLANWLQHFRGAIPEKWVDSIEVSETVAIDNIPACMISAAIAHPEHSVVLAAGFYQELNPIQLAVIFGRGLSTLTIEEILEGQSKFKNKYSRVKAANRLVMTKREPILQAFGLPVIPGNIKTHKPS